jgi:hypothetical protein
MEKNTIFCLHARQRVHAPRPQSPSTAMARAHGGLNTWRGAASAANEAPRALVLKVKILPIRFPRR